MTGENGVAELPAEMRKLGFGLYRPSGPETYFLVVPGVGSGVGRNLLSPDQSHTRNGFGRFTDFSVSPDGRTVYVTSDDGVTGTFTFEGGEITYSAYSPWMDRTMPHEADPYVRGWATHWIGEQFPHLWVETDPRARCSLGTGSNALKVRGYDTCMKRPAGPVLYREGYDLPDGVVVERVGVGAMKVTDTAGPGFRRMASDLGNVAHDIPVGDPFKSVAVVPFVGRMSERERGEIRIPRADGNDDFGNVHFNYGIGPMGNRNFTFGETLERLCASRV